MEKNISNKCNSKKAVVCLETSKNNGYEVLSYKKKYYYYYVANRHFDIAKIAMLSNAVQASKLSAM